MRHFLCIAALALCLVGCTSPEQQTQKAYEKTVSAFDNQIAKLQAVEDQSSATLTEMKLKQNEIWSQGKKAHDNRLALQQLRSFADRIKVSADDAKTKQLRCEALEQKLQSVVK